MPSPRPRPALVSGLVAVLLSGAALVALGACGSGATARQAGAGEARLLLLDVRIDRPANPDRAAVRLVVHNGTDAADVLIAVESPHAQRAEVHRSSVDAQGRATMGKVTRLPIPARSDVAFEPGGLHVMLTGLADALAVGDTVPITFTFAEAGDRTVQAKVVEPGSADDQEATHDEP